MPVRLRCLSNQISFSQTLSSSRGYYWDLITFTQANNYLEIPWQIEFNIIKYRGPGSVSWPWVNISLYLRRGSYYTIILYVGPESYKVERAVLFALEF